MHLSHISTSLFTALLVTSMASFDLAAQGSVSVAPDGECGTAPANSPANQVTFTVANTATDVEHADYFELSCIPLGSVSSCSISAESVLLDAREETQVTITFVTGSAGEGTVTVIAWGKNWHSHDPGHCRVKLEGAT